MKNKRYFIISGVAIFACFLIVFGILAIAKFVFHSRAISDMTSENIEKYTNAGVIEYLEDKGFKFSLSALLSSYGSTEYVHVSNPENNISFQRYTNPMIGTTYCWNDSSVNDEWADIQSSYENDKAEELTQFKKYEKWLKFMKLSSSQIVDALDYYKNNALDYYINGGRKADGGHVFAILTNMGFTFLPLEQDMKYIVATHPDGYSIAKLVDMDGSTTAYGWNDNDEDVVFIKDKNTNPDRYEKYEFWLSENQLSSDDIIKVLDYCEENVIDYRSK